MNPTNRGSRPEITVLAILILHAAKMRWIAFKYLDYGAAIFDTNQCSQNSNSSYLEEIASRLILQYSGATAQHTKMKSSGESGQMDKALKLTEITSQKNLKEKQKNNP